MSILESFSNINSLEKISLWIFGNQRMGNTCSISPNWVFSQSAIMRGAVLHKLQLKLVKSRIMKASYGLVAEPTFIPRQHPERLKFRDKVDGNYRCKDVMRWSVTKVLALQFSINIQGTRVEDEKIVRQSFVAHYSKMKFRLRRNLPLKCSVFICEEDNPPHYKNEKGTAHKEI